MSEMLYFSEDHSLPPLNQSVADDLFLRGVKIHRYVSDGEGLTGGILVQDVVITPRFAVRKGNALRVRYSDGMVLPGDCPFFDRVTDFAVVVPHRGREIDGNLFLACDTVGPLYLVNQLDRTVVPVRYEGLRGRSKISHSKLTMEDLGMMGRLICNSAGQLVAQTIKSGKGKNEIKAIPVYRINSVLKRFVAFQKELIERIEKVVGKVDEE